MKAPEHLSLLFPLSSKGEVAMVRVESACAMLGGVPRTYQVSFG
jgi:hypothetical protein